MTTSPIQIRNPRVVRDLRTLSDRLGRPITDVVGELAHERLEIERERDLRESRARSDEIDAVLASIDALPHDGEMLTDDDLYDEDGFPR